MARLEELFLGRERTVTLTDGQKLKIRQLPGTDIGGATDGSFVLPRWQGKAEGVTPLQRARKKWRPSERRYVAYLTGLSAVLRSRRLALFRAWLVDCPTFKIAEEIFREEVRGNIILHRTAEPDKFSVELRHKLREFGFVVQRAKRPETQEAWVKILFLYQDEAAGLNVGAMLARTVAITDRLRERLLGMYAWVRKYSAQRDALAAIETEINNVISRVASELNTLGRSRLGVIIQGGGNRNAQKLIADRLAAMSVTLEPLKFIQPFSRWMDFVIKDFDDLQNALERKDDEGQNFVLARALIERILFSIQLKKLQGELGRFLLRVGQDAIIKRLDWNNYAVWAASLVAQFRRLIEREQKVGLKERVCEQASRAAYDAFFEAGGRRRLAQFKATLKRAYAIL